MNEKILVVDDEKEIADLLEVYLKNDNYIVHKYYNGIEALECIQKTEIDLAILDVMLPAKKLEKIIISLLLCLQLKLMMAIK